MRILLADDNVEIRAALGLLLGEYGERDIVEAADGKQLLSLLGQGPVDVILLDWELPDGGSGSHDGLPAQPRSTSLVEQLRRRCGACRVIAMSGRSESCLESLRAGCDGFVSKNDPPDRLLALLQISRE
jgi:CheY-like chemotaxis protein